MEFYLSLLNVTLLTLERDRRWGEGASLALVGHPSSDGVTIKMPSGLDVLH